MPHARPPIALLAAALLGLSACRGGGATGPRPEPAPGAGSLRGEPLAERPRAPRHLRAPDYLPEAARDLVWARMQGHGTDSTLLLWAILFLDYDGAAELTRGMLAEPRLARPIAPDDGTLNALLPAEFFELQDELVVKLRALLEATGQEPRDGAQLARAYGELNAVCVRCHALYLEEPRARATGARR